MLQPTDEQSHLALVLGFRVGPVEYERLTRITNRYGCLNHTRYVFLLTPRETEPCSDSQQEVPRTVLESDARRGYDRGLCEARPNRERFTAVTVLRLRPD